jgi:DNA polymerase-3 subunit epsilon
MARALHPGQRNSLDALCKRYEVDNTHRELHGALLDAGILAEVYLAMTGGQVSLRLEGDTTDTEIRFGFSTGPVRRIPPNRPPLAIVRATADELAAHQARLAAIDKTSGGACVWLATDPAAASG